MEINESHPYTEIHGELIPREYFLSEIKDSWNIPPKGTRSQMILRSNALTRRLRATSLNRPNK